MIKNETISEKDVEMLRENFKIKYSKSKGWNPQKLTTEQIIEITQQKGWKSPGLLLS
jgi:hypothetical protein